MKMRKVIRGFVKRLVNWPLKPLGVHVTRIPQSQPPYFVAIEARSEEKAIIQSVRQYTMTSDERIWALINSISYIVKNEIPGDIVECGVWRGGSMMAAASQLRSLGAVRDIWLFDTFKGMTEPTSVDIHEGRSGREQWEASQTSSEVNLFCYASLEEAKHNLASTGYPDHLLHFVEGKVEDTLRNERNLPSRIALLRLDTDWYESTRLELDVLFDRVCVGGVVIFDDYGYWSGAQKAVDEFLSDHRIAFLLNRVDDQGRIGVKI